MEHLAALGLDGVDDLHGRHVVDARIDADLVEEQQALFQDRLREFFHPLADVGGGHHVLAVLQAQVGHLDVVDPGQQADDDIVLLDQGGQRLVVLHVDGHGPAVGVALDQLFGLAHRARGDGDRQVLLFQQVVDSRPADQAGAQDQYFFHCASSYFTNSFMY